MARRKAERPAERGVRRAETNTVSATSGTGALAGVTGEIVLTGTSQGPGAVGDVFTMTGTLTTPPPVPTDKDQCKNGGWKNLADDQGAPFKNQGQCVSFVMPGN